MSLLLKGDLRLNRPSERTDFNNLTYHYINSGIDFDCK